jgi:hypothetical protein
VQSVISNFIDKRWQPFSNCLNTTVRQSGHKTKVLDEQCGLKVTPHCNRIMTAQFRGERDARLTAIG